MTTPSNTAVPVPIEDVRPSVDGGRRPAKAVVGEVFTVSALVFVEGDGVLGAEVVLRTSDGGEAGRWPMAPTAPGSDRWSAEVRSDRCGRLTYGVRAWRDPVATWLRDATIKVRAGVDCEITLEQGAVYLEEALARVSQEEARDVLRSALDVMGDAALSPVDRLAAVEDSAVCAALSDASLCERRTESRPFPLLVERERALFGSWYEFFPRSEGAVVEPGKPPVSGTFLTAAKRLPAIAAMGFDVVYLPPVHPIGTTFRKGPDNSLSPGPFDVGVPWAIGSHEGGHDALHPDLGTFEDFDAFVARARDLGMEVALDFALQCSPDHPWVKQHPEWFRTRADGTIAHAENPPKQYQDIYPVAFDEDFRGIVRETLCVLRLWMERGVRIFRVDNPHTKPVVFWEKVLGDINRSDPDVLFLAEAFTRPAMVHTLAKIGFQQSYTYFTWRTGKQELTDYVQELSGEAAAYMRPNFFVNTPDILHRYLQEGGRPAFAVRAVLAATLSPSWGVYAGYELCEATPAGEGSEEYLDSEKFQLRPRDWAAAERAGTWLAPLIGTLNALRRRHPALRRLRGTHFHATDNEHVIAYSKRSAGPEDDTVLVVINLDPHHTHEATVSLDTSALGLTPAQVRGVAPIEVSDELTAESYHWGTENYVRLEPGREPAPAHVFSLRPSPSNGGSPNP